MWQFFKDISIYAKLIIAFLVAAMITALVGLIGLISSGAIAEEGRHVGDDLAPLVDAAMEVKLNAYMAHLWLEEILSGDDAEDIEEVWSYFEMSVTYCDMILKGGTTDEGHFVATGNEKVRNLTEDVRHDLEAVIQNAKKRYEMRIRASGIGSTADQEFDQLYTSIQNDLQAIIDTSESDRVIALAGQTRFLLADGHLFFEELVSGDQSRTFQQIKDEFAAAADLVEELGVILGQNRLRTIDANLNKFIEVVEQRFRDTSTAMQAGGEMDQAFDDQFDQFIQDIDDVETLIQQDMEQGFRHIDRQKATARFWIIFVTCLAFVVALGIGFLMAGMINVPLTKSLNLARMISKGDLSARIDVDRKDETGQLMVAMDEMTSYILEVANVADRIANQDLSVRVNPRSGNDVLNRAFGNMIDNLKTMIGKLNHSAISITKTAGELSKNSELLTQGAEEQSTSAEETSTSMEEMAASIQQISSNTDSLSTNVDETSASIEQMTRSIQVVAQNASELTAAVEQTSSNIEEMAASIEQVSNNTQEIKKSSETMVQGIRDFGEVTQKASEGYQQIAVAMENIGDVITKFDKNSKKINNIVDVIDEIAEQTNLLALNAAIEAARAGEHGRGFAVVADEVRKLAERSANSAKEIIALISEVQQDTSMAIKASERGEIEVRTGTEMARKASQGINDIIRSGEAVNRMVVEISKATEQQSRASEQMVKSAENMIRMTRQVDKATQEQANGSRQITKSVAVMNSMTSQVSRATAEQKRGGEQIVKAIENIASISKQNSEMAVELAKVVVSLGKQADELQDLTKTFRM